MENYINAELEVISASKIDVISASIEIEIETGENELPIDRFVSV